MNSMDNTTMSNMVNMDNMDMNHMDVGGHHTAADEHTLMKNYFHFSAQAIVLFLGWETMTWGGKS